VLVSRSDHVVCGRVWPAVRWAARPPRRARRWRQAAVPRSGAALIFHDLRHTGNQLTANAGANLRELMARMGHDGERAALIYLL
jgi:integrase